MRSLVAVALLVSLAGCLDFSPMTGSKSPSSSKVTSSSGKTSLDPTAPDCPDSQPTCIGDRECAFDQAKGCSVCRCASPLGPTPDVGGVPALH